MSPGTLGAAVLSYLDRAVHQHDLAVVDEVVAADYVGHGFAPDRAALTEFYAWQARSAPDWRIDVEDLVEEGDRVAVRAHAYGTRTESAPGSRCPSPSTATWSGSRSTGSRAA